MDALSWLKNKKDSKVIEHLKNENQLCEAYFNKLKSLREEVYREIIEKLKEEDVSAPFPSGQYEYFHETKIGKAYKTYFRKKKTSSDKELLFDENELSIGHSFFSLGDWDLSPDEKILAYSLDLKGDEYYQIFFKNLSSGEISQYSIIKTEGTFVFSNDSKSIFYLSLDESHRPYRVWKHLLDSDSADQLLYEEKDAAFYLGISASRDRNYLWIDSTSKNTSEIHALDLNTTQDSLLLIKKRVPNVLYSVEHRHSQLLMLSNDKEALNFMIQTASFSNGSIGNWRNLIEHNPEKRILDMEVFDSHMVLHERTGGLTGFRVYHFKTKEISEMNFPECSYYVEPEINEEFDSPCFRFTYESPIRPDTTYAYYFESKSLKELKVMEIPGGFSPENYQVEYINAPSHDGESVPMTIYYRKNTLKDSSTPCLLTGYGAYEVSREPYFQRGYFSLLDRGFIVAVGHIRGGGEKGRAWYEEGKLLKKKNSFLDFIACAEFLHKQGYSKPSKTSILGGSAGGLLMGAVCNMRPELFGAVVALVPFVDVFNTMSDPSLPLTITEYDEWGNPEYSPFREYILSYSPYENVCPQDYPAILATGGLNDPRVGYWEPAKWVQRIRDLRTNQNTLLLKTDLESGHGGPSGRYAQIQEQSYYLSFIIHQTL